MELNLIAAGIEFVGTSVKKLNITNNIVDIEKDGERSFGLNINEPKLYQEDNKLFAQILVDFEIEIKQDVEREFKMQLSVEGAFLSEENADREEFEELVMVNGVAALIGIARGKIEAISANIFNNGKVVIPFVNVIDYYNNLTE